MKSAEIRDRYAEIRRETFERYLLDLMREVAYEEERLHLLEHGEPYPDEIRKIDFFEPGSAANGFLITSFDHKKGVEKTQQWTLYDDPEFVREGKLFRDAGRIVGDILMWARGG